MSNLAKTHSSLGNHKEALQLETDALMLRECILPHSHPDIVKSRARIFLTHTCLGNTKDASQLEKSIKAQIESGLDRTPFNPDTILAMRSLANTYGKLWRDAECFAGIRYRGEHPLTDEKRTEMQWNEFDLREKILHQYEDIHPSTHIDIFVAKMKLCKVGEILGDTDYNFSSFQDQYSPEINKVEELSDNKHFRFTSRSVSYYSNPLRHSFIDAKFPIGSYIPGGAHTKDATLSTRQDDGFRLILQVLNTWYNGHTNIIDLGSGNGMLLAVAASIKEIFNCSDFNAGRRWKGFVKAAVFVLFAFIYLEDCVDEIKAIIRELSRTIVGSND
jgi:hypothetical protein